MFLILVLIHLLLIMMLIMPYRGAIRGRLNKYATVYPDNMGGASFEYSWAAIMHAINDNKPLLI